MTDPDPVTDVWELLWTAACDYRDANPTNRSESRLIDALMPVVTTYGDARVAKDRGGGGGMSDVKRCRAIDELAARRRGA